MREKNIIGVLFILPALVLFGALMLYPICYGIFQSFTDKDALIPGFNLIGFANYYNLLIDPQFWNSFKNGLVFAGATVIFQVALGLIAALVLNECFVGRSFVRVAVILPYMVPTVVIASIWRWLYSDTFGIYNFILMKIGLTNAPIAWLANTNLTMISVVIVNVWAFFPFVFLCFLSKLTTIPDELYEAAKIDGASAWRRFNDITLPHLKHILALVILLRGLWMFNKFDIIWLLTKGGPLRVTEHMPILVYKKAFQLWELGMGSAVAVTILFFLLITSLFYFKLEKQASKDT